MSSINPGSPEINELLVLLKEDWVPEEDKKIIKKVVLDMIRMMPDLMEMVKKMLKEANTE